jgi:hypothetical protein
MSKPTVCIDCIADILDDPYIHVKAGGASLPHADCQATIEQLRVERPMLLADLEEAANREGCEACGL